MYWDVSPPDKELYLYRCRKLRRCLEHVDVMPPFLVADQCRFVLRAAMGGPWRVVWWMLKSILHNYWGRFTENLWWTWHLYIRLRTMDEIIEICDRRLEDITGEDHREWPSVVIDEKEFQGKN